MKHHPAEQGSPGQGHLPSARVAPSPRTLPGLGQPQFPWAPSASAFSFGGQGEAELLWTGPERRGHDVTAHGSRLESGAGVRLLKAFLISRQREPRVADFGRFRKSLAGVCLSSGLILLFLGSLGAGERALPCSQSHGELLAVTPVLPLLCGKMLPLPSFSMAGVGLPQGNSEMSEPLLRSKLCRINYSNIIHPALPALALQGRVGDISSPWSSVPTATGIARRRRALPALPIVQRCPGLANISS